jgi:CRP-like cAMP-binding protein
MAKAGQRVQENRFANRILAAAPAASLRRMLPHLERFDLPARHWISHTTAPIEHMYFLERGLASMVKTLKDGRTIEVGAIGTEGVLGLFAIYGIDWSFHDSIIQIPGSALRIRPEIVRREMLRSPSLHELFWRYTFGYVSQLSQTAACNLAHTLEQRCCRWLLVASDNAQSDTFPLTHQFLAFMLGVRRSRVSVTCKLLQAGGLIDYRRNQVTIRDRAGLEAKTCECYATMREQFDKLLGPQSAS